MRATLTAGVLRGRSPKVVRAALFERDALEVCAQLVTMRKGAAEDMCTFCP